MKQIGNIIAGVGILLFVYSVIGRFVGGTTIGMGIVELTARSGLVTANSLMLIAILFKMSEK